MNKIQINTLDTLETVKDYYEVHLVDGYGQVFNNEHKRYLKPSVGKGKDNYTYYNLMTVDGRTRKAYIHRLIGLAWLDGYKEGYFVDHRDNDKSNNHISNLEWLSHAENTAKAVRDGTKIGRPRVPIKPKVYKSKLEISKSASNGRKQLTYDEVTNIFEMLKDGYYQSEIAEKFNIKQAAVSQLKNGRRWVDHPASIEYRKIIS